MLQIVVAHQAVDFTCGRRRRSYWEICTTLYPYTHRQGRQISVYE